MRAQVKDKMKRSCSRCNKEFPTRGRLVCDTQHETCHQQVVPDVVDLTQDDDENHVARGPAGVIIDLSHDDEEVPEDLPMLTVSVSTTPSRFSWIQPNAPMLVGRNFDGATAQSEPWLEDENRCWSVKIKWDDVKGGNRCHSTVACRLCRNPMTHCRNTKRSCGRPKKFKIDQDNNWEWQNRERKKDKGVAAVQSAKLPAHKTRNGSRMVHKEAPRNATAQELLHDGSPLQECHQDAQEEEDNDHHSYMDLSSDFTLSSRSVSSIESEPSLLGMRATVTQSQPHSDSESMALSMNRSISTRLHRKRSQQEQVPQSPPHSDSASVASFVDHDDNKSVSTRSQQEQVPKSPPHSDTESVASSIDHDDSKSISTRLRRKRSQQEQNRDARADFVNSFEIVSDKRQSDPKGMGVITRKFVPKRSRFVDAGAKYHPGKPPRDDDERGDYIKTAEGTVAAVRFDACTNVVSFNIIVIFLVVCRLLRYFGMHNRMDQRASGW